LVVVFLSLAPPWMDDKRSPRPCKEGAQSPPKERRGVQSPESRDQSSKHGSVFTQSPLRLQLDSLSSRLTLIPWQLPCLAGAGRGWAAATGGNNSCWKDVNFTMAVGMWIGHDGCWQGSSSMCSSHDGCGLVTMAVPEALEGVEEAWRATMGAVVT